MKEYRFKTEEELNKDYPDFIRKYDDFIYLDINPLFWNVKVNRFLGIPLKDLKVEELSRFDNNDPLYRFYFPDGLGFYIYENMITLIDKKKEINNLLNKIL